MKTILLFFSMLGWFSHTACAFERIVVLAPMLSGWTAEVLGEAKAKKTLVGLSEYSNYPVYLKTVPTIGAYPKLNVEKIAALHPDLVVGSLEYNLPEQIEQLKRLKLNVQLMPKETFSGMPAWIQQLGKIFGAEEESRQLIKRWMKEVGDLKAKTAKSGRVKTPVSVYLEIQHDPMITIGGDSFLNEAFAIAGYENIFQDLPQAYPKVSKEAVLKAKPEAVFILDLTGNPEDFSAPKKDWEKFGFKPRVISGDDFARCSFLLLQGLRSL